MMNGGFPQMKFPRMPQMGQGLQPPQMQPMNPQMMPNPQAMQGGPQMQPLGQPQMNAPTGQFPVMQPMGQPQMGMPNGQFPAKQMGGMQFDHSGFHDAKMDWRGQRPDRPEDHDGMQAWRDQMMAWRGDRPDRGDYRQPGMLPNFGG